LVGAVVFGVASTSAGRDAEKLCDGQLCPTSARGALNREKRFAVAAEVSAVLGIASAGVGAYLLYRARGDKQREKSLAQRVDFTPTVFADGVGVGVNGAF
jgi:hypothetical protein